MWGKWGGSNIGYRKLSSGLEPILLSIHMACVGCKNHILRHSHMTISGSPIDCILLSMFRYMVSQYPNKIPRAGEPQHSWDKDVRKNDIYRLHRYWSSNDGFSSVPEDSSFSDHWPMPGGPQRIEKKSLLRQGWQGIVAPRFSQSRAVPKRASPKNLWITRASHVYHFSINSVQ